MEEFLNDLVSTWWGILIICVLAVAVWVLLSALLYRQFFKRFYDIVLSGLAIIVFSPLLILLTIIGAIKMKGNPFFTQQRPGKNEKIFKLIKFRTMTCEKDENGNLLPDEQRLTKYGKLLRSTSLDELPELVNIFIGNMSIVGPRPLLVEYLPYYTVEEKNRHNIRPGLTGLAQINGRNNLSWDDRLHYDVIYEQKYSLWLDISILFKTVIKVIKRSDISENTAISEGNLASIRRNKQ
jgi:lipopolysaccharide/colanic/teichoic acid biosynthesis glycosyltransferase